MTPAWTAAILKSRAFQVFARIVLTTPFWAAGVQHALQWNASLGEMTHFGLSPPALYLLLTIVTCLAGSALVIAGGRWTWLGAGWLGVFTALTIPIAHAFWTMSGDAAMGEFRTVIEHVSIIGGLMMVAVLLNGTPQTEASS
jgi:transmembrane protein